VIGHRRARLDGRFVVKIPPEIRQLIESGCPAHLVTLNRDGSPQVTLVWIGLEGDEIVAGPRRNRRFATSSTDPRVQSRWRPTARFDGADRVRRPLRKARIQQGGAPELLQRLAYVYLGPGVKFPPMDNPPPGYVTRIRVDRIEGVGPWTGRPV
jgi:hypothetical protein